MVVGLVNAVGKDIGTRNISGGIIRDVSNPSSRSRGESFDWTMFMTIIALRQTTLVQIANDLTNIELSRYWRDTL